MEMSHAEKADAFDCVMDCAKGLVETCTCYGCLVERLAATEAELQQTHRKAAHGCYDFFCPECDGGE